MMNTDQLKEKYYRFKQWQERPYEYKLHSENANHCINCGNEYVGNYCPICSQKADMGRISWKSVHSGLMDIWGLGTRSLLYTVWQLLWRPGHIIGDYIDGKRQVSFPPVKMLFIVAVLYSMLYYWLLSKAISIDGVVENEIRAFDDFSNSVKNYYSWYALIMAMLAVLPTWFLFRYSPRHTAHTLPEGFFIQVFLANIMLILCFLTMPLLVMNYYIYSYLAICLLAFYYTIVYRYLFGYGLWGTLWRCGFILFGVVFIVSAATFLLFDIDFSAFSPYSDNLSKEQLNLMKYKFGLGCLIISGILFVVGYVFNLIATRKARRMMRNR